jgi:hypothetical protein
MDSSAVQKRGRGRPPKYRDDEERKVARRIQILKAVKNHRNKKKNEVREDESCTSLEAFKATLAAKPACSAKDVNLEILPTRHGDSNEVVSSEAFIAFEEQVAQARLPSLDNLVMRNATLLVSSLLEDFFNLAGQSEDWWPWYNASEHLYSNKIGARLLGYSNVANFASCMGKARGDQALSSMGRSAYCDTLALLRHYTQDKYIQQVGIILVLMTNDMINHEMSEFLVNSDCPEDRWSIHSLAGNRIIEQAGPEMFRGGLGAKVLVGHMSRMVSTNGLEFDA